MMGLVVIVLLLIIIGVIYLRFQLKPDDQVEEITRVDIQSEHCLSALSMLTICSGKDLEDAMKLCSSGQNSLICGKKSCEIVEDKADGSLLALFPEKYAEGLISFTLQDMLPGNDDAEIFVEASRGYECSEGRTVTFVNKKVSGTKAHAVLAWCGT
ncbi:MAG: hypothetical protein ABIB71_01400 [Candidatus Woesearchaeota archaeon]